MSSFKRLEVLKDRAVMMGKVRAFFNQRGIIEVDCPLLSASASVDAHIDLIPVYPNGDVRYLHSSPEYGMKRLLGEGLGDIFQLSHVFRNGDIGKKHNPEFMMVEWYRVDLPFESLIEETLELIRLFLGDLPSKTFSYREAFLDFLDLDYLQATADELLQILKKHKITPYPNLNKNDRDELLNFILGNLIEPQLGIGELSVLAYYPASQAALSKICYRGDEKVCKRFEVYYQGVELANGYDELIDPIEQRNRLSEANDQREKMGKQRLPIDENFVRSLEKGLPNCVGVAVGFDRLMMLRHQASSLAEVMPFYWANA